MGRAFIVAVLARLCRQGRAAASFTISLPVSGLEWDAPVRFGPMEQEVGHSMVAIAAMMFVALFAWGQSYFHWSDPAGKVQLALFTSFILGIICGYKTKG
jgi:hypothetical protein